MIIKFTLPADTLLASYRAAPDADESGSYMDCYVTDVPQDVTLTDFVFAFYCTPLFKLERRILGIALRRPSTDEQARAVANGDQDTFATWTVAERRVQEILLCDMSGHTRSWFKVEPKSTAKLSLTTRLHFGSAVIAARHTDSGATKLGLAFRLLLPFHRWYSQALLKSAAQRVIKNGSG